MIRQNILKEVAIDRAIELFLENPFEGEMQDGDLLTLLASIDWSKFIKNGKLVDVAKLITQLESSYLEFEWTNESESESYKHNLRTLKENLAH